MVMFKELGRWIMTPEYNEKLAEKWAERHKFRLLAVRESIASVRNMASGFFDDEGQWAKKQRGKGRTFGAPYLQTKRGHLENYIVPLLGDMLLPDLTPGKIEEAILGALKQNGKPLAPATKYKIIDTIRIFLDEMVIRGIIASNPIGNLIPYSKRPIAPRGALPRELFPLLFPHSHGELVKVWHGSMWASMMCLFRDTGLRDGEIRALRWKDLYLDERIVPIRNGIKSGTAGTIGTTKTEQVKAGILSPRTVQELTIWRAESRHSAPDDFIFTLDGESPVSNTGVVKAFRRGLAEAGIDDTRYTPYWLRHSFITYSMEGLEDSEILMLAGHTNLITNTIYRHPDDEIIIARARPIREKMDKARG